MNLIGFPLLQVGDKVLRFVLSVSLESVVGNVIRFNVVLGLYDAIHLVSN